MLDKEVLEHLSYSKCDCPIDYKAELGIVNAVCPKHSNSTLLVDGIHIEIYSKMVKAGQKLAKKPNSIV